MRYISSLLSSLLFVLFLFACADNAEKVEQAPPKSKSSITEEEVVEVIDTFISDSTDEELVQNAFDPLPIIRFDYDTTQWTDIGLLAPSIVLDLKYATTDNFVETKMYDCARCFLRPEIAARIVAIHQQLQKQGLALKMFDCYRPRPIQQALWDKVPDPRYVADPKKGSMHNRGVAVDLSIVDAKGIELDMGTPFDYFGKEAYHDYTKHTDEINANRKLLKGTMEDFGFKSIRTEWWHYSYMGKGYALDDMLWNCETR